MKIIALNDLKNKRNKLCEDFGKNNHDHAFDYERFCVELLEEYVEKIGEKPRLDDFYLPCIDSCYPKILKEYYKLSV